MKKLQIKNSEMKKMLLGTAAVICVCTLGFKTLTQVTKAAIYNKTETVSTNYNIDSIKESVNSNVPEGYVKSNYKVKLVDIPDKPTDKDMTMKGAAELGAQNLWRLFDEKLRNQTIYMTYMPANGFQSRALWYGEVNINNERFYSFQLDSITGEYYTTSRWDYSKEHGKATEFLKHYQKYLSTAKETVEKYKLLSGKVISTEYVQQRYLGPGSIVIDILVKSDKGQKIQLTYSTYSKKLTFVSYNICLDQEKINIQKSNKSNLE